MNSFPLCPSHERYGAGSNSWLTGTASWMYYAVTQYILGFRPDYDGFVIDPCIPDTWNGFEMVRIYRGVKCKVSVKGNADVTSVSINGRKILGNYIPYSMIENMSIAEIEVCCN